MKLMKIPVERLFSCLLLLLFAGVAVPCVYAGRAQPFLEKGWEALVKDRDAEAFRQFSRAFEVAEADHDLSGKGEALLNMGICAYSVSYTRGLRYAFRAMEVFRRLEASDPETAADGRARCLQLISTIHSRRGDFRAAIRISKEALAGLSKTDSSGNRGLMYNSLGVAYGKLGQADSSAYFHRLALSDHLRAKNRLYLPNSLLYVAQIELKNGHFATSRNYFDRSLALADSMENRQAIVSALLGLGEWQLAAANDPAAAAELYRRAGTIARTLTDRSFHLKVLEHRYTLYEREGNYKAALRCQQEMNAVRDLLFSAEKLEIQQQLEVQFDVSEKERRLRLVSLEKDRAQLTNYLLWTILLFIAVLFAGVVWSMKRINRRNRQLLETQQDLARAREEQQLLEERQLKNELTHKEEQLGALTVQMLRKNEWITGLKTQVEQGSVHSPEALGRLLDRELNRDQEWTDFNAQFERINTRFYSHLKRAYPEISPNDLRLCALIRLNLSIKEMAAILNISPDSVKTARYRLRKKFRLNGEDNLTDFILGLS